MGKYVATLGRKLPPYTPEAIRNHSLFFSRRKKEPPKNWFWEYKICFSCDDSWKLADEFLTEEEARKRSVDFVNESFKYGVAVDVRCKKMELCERCKKIGQ